MGNYRTKEDDVAKISTSIFVTNFPKSFSAKDLFQSCKQYGHVVDTFIPNKRSKADKRFGFVQFINVFNDERLVNNLCTICNDRLKLHANIARFNMAPLKENNIRKNEGNMECDSIPAMVLDDECLFSKDVTNSLMGWVKDFFSLSHLKIALTNEEYDFTMEGRIVWVEVEGVPFKLWTKKTFKRIANKWGDLLDIPEIMEVSDDDEQSVEDVKTHINVAKIFTSIFVTNFPESFSAKDLFQSCKQYGHVVDTFIPNKRSKADKRFGFVQFINVFNDERLVNNLCTICNDRLKLHANIARFNRAPLKENNIREKEEGKHKTYSNAPSKDNGFMAKSNSFAQVVKRGSMSRNMECDSIPAMVLDDECLFSKDVTNSLMGWVKDFFSLSNLKIALTNEGFDDINIRYMGELWVMLKFASCKSNDLFRSNVGAGSWFSVLQQAEYDFTMEGRIVWVEVEEIMEVSDDDEQSVKDVKGGDIVVHEVGNHGEDSDVDEVSETMFDESSGQKKKQSEDPFGIYPLLDK
nr:nucleotide-binding alpha-beta plait domain-containing protein [Tanacetum cinerariifolium]